MFFPTKNNLNSPKDDIKILPFVTGSIRDIEIDIRDTCSLKYNL